jgi:hypothetical protein
MAITTYAEVQAAVANWLDRTDLTSRIPEFIALAETQMNRALRVSRMIQIDTATIGTDNRYSTVPTNYLEAKSYSVSRDGMSSVLKPAPLEVLATYRQASDSAGTPRYYATTGTPTGRQFEHYPTPDQDYTGTLTFYAKIPALSITNVTNWVLDDAPDAYLYGSLLQAAPFLRDNEQMAVWNQGFQGALQGLRDMDRTPAGELRADIGLTARRSGSYDITQDF